MSNSGDMRMNVKYIDKLGDMLKITFKHKGEKNEPKN